MDSNVSREIFEMLEKSHQMLHTAFDGFMKHDIDLLNQVLKGEEELTETYNKLTSSVVELKKKSSKREKVAILGIIDIIGSIEKVGDCCVSLVERIEYKIREKLLFSETAVKEYKDLYTQVDQVLSDTTKTIRMEDGSLAKKLMENEASLNDVVDKYKAGHLGRLARGICDARASVMYLDMLDFTKEIVHHCVSIAKQVLKIHK